MSSIDTIPNIEQVTPYRLKFGYVQVVDCCVKCCFAVSFF